METLLTTALEREIEAAQGETISLLKALCAIPAPSHHEERRAEWIQAWLEKRGLSAEIDDAKNVRCGFGLSQYQDIVVITHTVYYMPNADIYTRRAWDLDAQYTDLVNYITMRKGTIYMGTGTITRIVSTTPQMAIMNIGNDNFEKLVMLENSSKTTWTVGTKYRIYGEAYGLYDTMPRLTVRYTYLVE